MNPLRESCNQITTLPFFKRDSRIVDKMHADYEQQRVAANAKVAERLMQVIVHLTAF